MPAAARFKVRGLAPTTDPSWRAAGLHVQAAFMNAALAYVLKAKDQELAAGLDKDGVPLVPIRPGTKRHRLSRMGPADPAAPPLTPAYATSRTRLWLTAKVVDGTTIEVSWRNDWGDVLRHHARGGRRLPVRDVIGISPASLTKAKGWALGWWLHYKRTGQFLSRNVPATGGFKPLAVTGRTDFENFTFGIGSTGSQEAEVARSRLLLEQGRTTGFRRRRPGEGRPAIGGPGTLGPPRFGGGGPGPLPPPVVPRPPLPKFGPTRADVALEGNRDEFSGAVLRTFGRPLDDREIATLAGAPDSSKVALRDEGHSILAEWWTETAHAYRRFRPDKDGRPFVSNDSFQVDAGSRGKGVGAAAFGRQVEAAREANASRIMTFAAREHDAFGYKVWPRFGYDAPIPDDLVELLPDSLKEATRISDLMRTEDGRAWWETNGRGTWMEFDLAPGSLSIRTWEAYLRAKATSRTSRPKTLP